MLNCPPILGTCLASDKCHPPYYSSAPNRKKKFEIGFISRTADSCCKRCCKIERQSGSEFSRRRDKLSSMLVCVRLMIYFLYEFLWKHIPCRKHVETNWDVINGKICFSRKGNLFIFLIKSYSRGNILIAHHKLMWSLSFPPKFHQTHNFPLPSCVWVKLRPAWGI